MSDSNRSSSSAASGTGSSGPVPGTSEFLTFKLGAEEYGVEILKVQ